MKFGRVFIMFIILMFALVGTAMAEKLVEVMVDSKVRFTYSPNETKEYQTIKAEGDFPPFWNGFDPYNDDIHIDFNTGFAGVVEPCWWIPPDSLEKKGNTYRLRSKDPDKSGVMYSEDGQTPAPIKLEFVDFRLRITEGHEPQWSLKLVAEGTSSPFQIDDPIWWIPASANIITIQIGDDTGSAIRNSMVGIWQPPGS